MELDLPPDSLPELLDLLLDLLLDSLSELPDPPPDLLFDLLSELLELSERLDAGFLDVAFLGPDFLDSDFGRDSADELNISPSSSLSSSSNVLVRLSSRPPGCGFFSLSSSSNVLVRLLPRPFGCDLSLEMFFFNDGLQLELFALPRGPGLARQLLACSFLGWEVRAALFLFPDSGLDSRDPKRARPRIESSRTTLFLSSGARPRGPGPDRQLLARSLSSDFSLELRGPKRTSGLELRGSRRTRPRTESSRIRSRIPGE